MHEFVFDAKLVAVVSVKAESYTQARKALSAILAVDLSDATMGGLSEARGITITEATLSMDDANGPLLVELDGECIEEHQSESLAAGTASLEDLLAPDETPTMADVAGARAQALSLAR